MTLKYFSRSEFDSPDLKGSGDKMSGEFLEKLDEAREVTLGEGGAEVEVEEEVLTKREKILLARKKQLQRRRVGNRPIPPVLK